MATRAQKMQQLKALQDRLAKAQKAESQRNQMRRKLDELDRRLAEKRRALQAAAAQRRQAQRRQAERSQAQRRQAQRRQAALRPRQGLALQRMIALYSDPAVWADVPPAVAQELWRQLISGVRRPNYNGRELPYVNGLIELLQQERR
jgi:hypothetical protein